MLNAYIALAMTFSDWKQRVTTRTKDETGASAIELVVIGGGLLLLALAVIGAIKSAVDSRIGQIS